MSMANAGKIRRGVGRDPPNARQSRSPLSSGRFACAMPTRVTLTGRSSWPTRHGWQTMLPVMQQSGREWHAGAARCCKALWYAGDVAGAWACATRALMVTTRFITAVPVSCATGSRAASRCAPYRWMRRSSRNCLLPWRPIRLHSPLPPLGKSRPRPGCWRSNGRSSARYEAERARRQYDAVEPENRLVARSLERVWEEKLRGLEAVEQAYDAWQREQSGPLGEAECAEVSALAQDLPRVWRAATAAERKRILRLVVRDVVLDQKRERGLVWMRITWQTGASSEHQLQRRVRSYADCSSTEHLRERVQDLNAAGKMDQEIADSLNAEGIISARGVPFRGEPIHLLRKQWGIRTVKINGKDANPLRWPDGSYSIQGAAAALEITAQTVFKWLRKGRLQGHQLAKGQPWQVILPADRINVLCQQVRRTRRSK